MARRTRIKICGMTEQYEVEQAVAAGVDAIGFIFAPKSPRAIDPERARDIISRLPPFVDAVGVFVNEDPARVAEIVNFCKLTIVQLHGQEPPEYCEMLPVRVIKAFSVRDNLLSEDLEGYNEVVDAYLLDTYHEEMAGGSGETFDWSLVASLAPEKPLVLAGGLTPENVVAAITEVRPFAVDVNSGIEVSPGRKEIEKIHELARAVARADMAVAEQQ